MVPMGGNKIAPNPALVDTYPDVYLTTGLVAENHVRDYGISREEQDAFALRSHQKAVAAIDAGRFDAELIGVPLGARAVSAIPHLASQPPPTPPPCDRPLKSAYKPGSDPEVGRACRSGVRPRSGRGRGAAAGYVDGGAGEAPPGVPREGHRYGGKFFADERRRGGRGRHERRARARTGSDSARRGLSASRRPGWSLSDSGSDLFPPCARC